MNSVTSINKLDLGYSIKQQSVTKRSDNLSDLDEESPRAKLQDDTDCELDQETPMIMHSVDSDSSPDETDVDLDLQDKPLNEAELNLCLESETKYPSNVEAHCEANLSLEVSEENQTVSMVHQGMADESKV